MSNYSYRLDELKKNETALLAIEKQLKEISKPESRSARKLQDEYDSKNDEQVEACKAFLFEFDEEYQRFHKEIMKLFACKNIRFKVLQSSRSDEGIYGYSFSGRIHENGYSYLDLDHAKGNGIFESMKYPSKFKGKIDVWGKIEIKTVETEKSFTMNLPEIIEGTIDDEGNIILETKTCTLDFGGTDVMSKIIGDHFGHQPLHLEVFLKMRALLIGKISKLRKEIVGEILRESASDDI